MPVSPHHGCRVVAVIITLLFVTTLILAESHLRVKANKLEEQEIAAVPNLWHQAAAAVNAEASKVAAAAVAAVKKPAAVPGGPAAPPMANAVPGSPPVIPPNLPPGVKPPPTPPGAAVADANFAPAVEVPAPPDVAEYKPPKLEVPPVRWMTHIATDKPIYKPGEQVYIRGTVVNAHNFTPPANSIYPWGTQVEVVGPQGETVFTGGVPMTGTGATNGHVVGASWTIPPTLAGGIYTLRLTAFTNEVIAAQRKIQILDYRPRLLRLQADFDREGYTYGQTGEVNVIVEQSEGGPAVGAKLTSMVVVKGVEVERKEGGTTDEEGHATIQFTLPAQDTPLGRFYDGDASLTVVVEAGGKVESVTKTIPLATKDVRVDVYPEGGYLVEKVANTIYIEATLPSGDPFDLEGSICEVKGGPCVANVVTTHEGRGVTDKEVVPPSAAAEYELRVTNPPGIGPYPLPKVWSSPLSCSLRVPVTTEASNDAVTAVVSSPKAGKFNITVSRREVVLVEKEAVVEKPSQVVPTKLPLKPTDPHGVLRVTVSDAKTGIPLAERLIFRLPPDHIDIKVTTTPSDPNPGDEVTMEVTAVHAKTKAPVKGAVLGVTVSDDRTRKMVPKRDRAPRLAAMAWLEDEVGGTLTDAGSYWVTEEDFLHKVDLLLGTQGWRRFAYLNERAFLNLGSPLPTCPGLGATQDTQDRCRHYMTVPATSRLTSLTKADRERALSIADFQSPIMFRRGFMPPGAPPGAMAEAMPVGVAVAAQANAFGAPGPKAAGVVHAVAHASPPPAAGGAMPIPPAMPVAAPMPAQDAVAPVPPMGMDNAFAPRAPALKKRAPPMGEGAQANPDEFPMPIMGDATPSYPGSRMITVREYAHTRPPTRAADTPRSDFTETVYWSSTALVLGDKGQATVKFTLSDSITTYAVEADLVSTGGIIGRGDGEIRASMDLSIEAKTPVLACVGDTLRIPCVVRKSPVVKEDSFTLALNVTGGLHPLLADLDVPPGAVVDEATTRITMAFEAEALFQRVNWPIQVDGVDVEASSYGGETEASISFAATAGKFGDALTQPLRLLQPGFPIIHDKSGLFTPLEPGVHWSFDLPPDLINGTADVRVDLYPSPIASLTKALEVLIREPFGCFEQASATIYPLAMAQQYFLRHPQENNSMVERAATFLDKGLQQLVGYESKGGGFEWFGGSPAHEALTAYAVLEFTDMAQVMQLPDGLLDRTTQWLVSRKAGNGQFQRNPQSLDSFGAAPPTTTDAYIIYCLVVANIPGMEKEVDYLVGLTKDETFGDTYVLGLTAATLYHLGRMEEARALSRRVASFQDDKSGVVGSALASITSSMGQALQLECTAVAVLAWVQDYVTFGPEVEKAIRFIAESCQAGRFSSTQATVLSLKAIIAYEEARAASMTDVSVDVLLDGKAVGSLAARAGDQEVKTLVISTKNWQATPGSTHELTLASKFDGLNAKIKVKGAAEGVVADTRSMLYSVRASSFAKSPPTSPEVAVSLTTTLPKGATAIEGEMVPIEVVVKNVRAGKKEVPMVVAVIGIPAGLELVTRKLEELRKAGKVDAFDISRGDLNLYWRGLGPDQEVKLMLETSAAIPGTYRGQASRAYLYYTDELKAWAKGLVLRIE